MRFEEYITEGRVSTSDRRKLSSYIMNKKHGTLTLKGDFDSDEKMVEIEKVKKGILFTYNSENIELTATLVDICDTLGYEFEQELIKPKKEMRFTVLI